MSGPLDGMTVLDFTRYQQGPSATLISVPAYLPNLLPGSE